MQLLLLPDTAVTTYSVYGLGDPRTDEVRSISDRKPPVHRGEKNNAAKLTEESVKEMRRLHKEGVSGAELARRFGITPTNVSYIVRGLAWKHVKFENT